MFMRVHFWSVDLCMCALQHCSGLYMCDTEWSLGLLLWEYSVIAVEAH